MTIQEKTDYWLANPWSLYHRPFRIIENVYFVGLDWVSAFLLDTDKGLVLIDCAMQETWYLIVDNIRALGFDPANIKYLLLSHGHFDHVGAARAVQEMSGCETWIGKGDAFFFTERRDLIAMEETVPEFKIDHFYDYSTPMDFGNMILRPVFCPGHTPGTTSMFIDTKHEGKPVTLAMHGGLGAGVLHRATLIRQLMDPEAVWKTYFESIDRVINEKVDIVLPSHVGHLVDHDFFGIADRDDGTGNGFVDPTAWKRMLSGKRRELERLIEKENS